MGYDMVVYNWTRDGMVVSNRDTPAPEYVTLPDHLARLAEVELAREEAIAIWKECDRQRDALQRELEMERQQLRLTIVDQVSTEAERNDLEHENQRLRQVLVTLQQVCEAEGHLAMIVMLHKEVQALHHAARRGEDANHE